MSLDLEYAEACMPSATTVFGVRLRPFSVGHWIMLLSIQSPFAIGGKRGPDDLMLALYVCSQKASDLLSRPQRGLPLSWRWKAYRVLFVSLLWPGVFVTRMLLFEMYLHAACKPLNVWCPAAGGSRMSTCPEPLLLRRAAMRSGYTDTEAMDAPLRKLRFEQVAMLEDASDGKFAFVSDRERASAERNRVTAN